MKNFNTALFTFFIGLFLLNSLCLISEAVYEGSANANSMIRYYERKGEFGKAALWQEAAAKCIEVISIPLAKVTMEYHKQNDNIEHLKELESEIADIRAKQNEYLHQAKLNWENVIYYSGNRSYWIS